MPATKTKLRGVVFQEWQIRAMAGGMSQFRVPLQKQPGPYTGGALPGNKKKHDAPYIDAYCGETKTESNPRGMGRDWYWWTEDNRLGPFIDRCPYQPGDVLFVKETHGYGWDSGEGFYTALMPTGEEKPEKIIYKADGYDESEGRFCWRQSTRMREADSRFRIEITKVGVERRQEITIDDIERCGIREDEDGFDSGEQQFWERFAQNWDAQHAKRNAWAENGWDWAFDFLVTD